MTLELDEYRRGAESFLSELEEEYYLQLAGLKSDLALEPIYERYADLATLEACLELAPAASVEAGSVQLWRFACEGFLGYLTRAEEEELACIEASLSAPVDGESIPFRMLRSMVANEPDRAKRTSLDRARAELTERYLNPHHANVFELIAEALPALGAQSQRELYERFGFRLEELGSACERFLDDTESLYVEHADPLLRRRTGVGFEEALPSDVTRAIRAPEWDGGFPRRGMLSALGGTLADLGIDLRSQMNVELDIEDRPMKWPRAFCSPIRVPERIVLVIKPIGGVEDWRMLFHEAGHAEHFAHTSSRLPFEARCLGDNAVTEGWAFLLEHLVGDPDWLRRRLDFAEPETFARESACVSLYFTRRYCAKLLYELELRASGDLTGMPERYRELLFDATRITPHEADYLADIDAGFYASSYLRAWAFEAQVAAHLRERFGRAWFASTRAGSLLRELWHEGQGMTADELLDQLTDAPLELSAVGDRVREILS